jgi:AraC-like DNA-binding protein
VNIFDLPQQAVDAFERSTHWHVTIHVIDPKIWSMLPPSLHSHLTQVCQLAKQMGDERCVAFDQHAVRRELESQPDGFVKICHAGLVECVVPVVRHDGARTLRLVIFAGQGRAGSDLHTIKPLQSPVRMEPLHDRQLASLPMIDADQAMLRLELLRQLGARLGQWLLELEDQPAALTDQLKRSDRRRWIEVFIQTHHTRDVDIGDIAHALGVSRSRAAHLVTQICGRSFGQLLTDARIRTAASLLTYTHLSVLDIALRSGFGDVSNFHRRFRERLGLSPLQYRKRAEVYTPLTISGSDTPDP